jgi:hypothetical protein
LGSWASGVLLEARPASRRCAMEYWDLGVARHS